MDKSSAFYEGSKGGCKVPLLTAHAEAEQLQGLVEYKGSNLKVCLRIPVSLEAVMELESMWVLMTVLVAREAVEH